MGYRVTSGDDTRDIFVETKAEAVEIFKKVYPDATGDVTAKEIDPLSTEGTGGTEASDDAPESDDLSDIDDGGEEAEPGDEETTDPQPESDDLGTIEDGGPDA